MAAGEYLDSPVDIDISNLEYNDLITVLTTEAQGDPATLQEAMSHSDWPKWHEAMDKELATLECAHTWDSVPWPINKNVISSKWVFRIKCKADGTIEKYKVCLVAHGFTQIYGIDYSSTYSPVLLS